MPSSNNDPSERDIPPETVDKETDKQTGEKGRPEYPGRQSQGAKPTKTYCAHECNPGALPWLNFVVQVLLFFATVGAFIAAAYYASIAKETLVQIEHQTQSVKVGADAAESAADTASKTLDEMKKSSRLDQRAWVGLVENTPPPLLNGPKAVYAKEGEKITVGVIITNSGKTPAMKFRPKRRLVAIPAGKPFIPDYSAPTVNQSVVVIQPGMKVPLNSAPTDMPMTKSQIDQFSNGKLVLYYYGRLQYEDIFGNAHETNFCMYMGRDLATMEFCNTHNDAY
jgi:hypothetical protein